MYDNLDTNKKLTVLLARTTFAGNQVAEVQRLLDEAIDWYAVLNACVRNKTLPLAWKNLRDLELISNVPQRMREVFSFYASGTAHKNQALLAQFHEVSKALKASGIQFAPLKGLILVNEIYTMDSRQMSDLDFMICKRDCPRVRQVLNSIGFVEGEYDSASRTVRPLDRRKRVLWSLYMYNLPAFMKALDDEYLNVAEIDMTFDIRFESKRPAADAFLRDTCYYAPLDCEALKPEEFLLHLCCHLYKEAKNTLWVEREADFNLIKFCDVREYTLRILSSLDLDRFVYLAQHYEVEAAVYFTFYYLSQIYEDGHEAYILRHLPTVEESALYSYGERDFGVGIQIPGSFWHRFFTSDYSHAERGKSTYSSLI